MRWRLTAVSVRTNQCYGGQVACPRGPDVLGIGELMRFSSRAFTLIEIMMVVVLLGIIAAIAIPQISGASGEAHEAALRNDLRLVRTQIELYRLQHDGLVPGYVLQADGTVSEWTGPRFILQLVSQTDVNGDLGGFHSDWVIIGSYYEAI